MKPRTFSLSIFAAAILLIAPAFAAGPTLINQATVQAAGGFPYVINQSGSYQLSSDLIVPCGDADGIDVTAAHVTLDLNGFTISCSVLNAFNGVSIVGVPDVVVQNGSITGFGGARRGANAPVSGAGISFEPPSSAVVLPGKVDHVRFTGNGDGVDASDATFITVTNCVIVNNSGNGVSSASNMRVEDSDVSYNGENGIVLTLGTAIGNQIYGNAGSGIAVGSNAMVTNNLIVSNGITNASAWGLGGLNGASPGGIVGFGSNAFFGNGALSSDVQPAATIVSMKNNVNTNGTLF